MKFVKPSADLHQALQTSNLFLVTADPTRLGAFTGYPNACPDPGTDPAFCNWMNIEEWAIEADVPETPPYDNYSNVMIIKGRRGKLTDLVANPDLWTQKDQFSIPNKDASQLVVLSLWLQRYLREARQDHADNPFFAKFLQIIDDENWTGILILKADIVAVPEQLVGLLGGIDMSRFNAHHFGIDIAKVDGGTIEIPHSNSMFGLIYYVDPNHDPASGAKPIPPAPKADYDFKVLTLQVLFENTAVKDFQSLAQLTMNKLFDEPVTRMGDPSNIYNLDRAQRRAATPGRQDHVQPRHGRRQHVPFRQQRAPQGRDHQGAVRNRQRHPSDEGRVRYRWNRPLREQRRVAVRAVGVHRLPGRVRQAE